MPQSHGIVPFAKAVDLSYLEPMVAPVQGSALQAVHTRDISVRQTFDELPHWKKMELFKREGYYGWKNHGQVLESNNDTGLQSAVSKVASRYIGPEGRIVVHGKADGDQSS